MWAAVHYQLLPGSRCLVCPLSRVEWGVGSGAVDVAASLLSLGSLVLRFLGSVLVQVLQVRQEVDFGSQLCSCVFGLVLFCPDCL